MEWIIGLIVAVFWVGAGVWFLRHFRSEQRRTAGDRPGGFRVLGGAAPWDAYGSPVGQAPPLIPESGANNGIR